MAWYDMNNSDETPLFRPRKHLECVLELKKQYIASFMTEGRTDGQTVAFIQLKIVYISRIFVYLVHQTGDVHGRSLIVNDADVLDAEAGDKAEALDPAGVLGHHEELEAGVAPLLARPLQRLEPPQLVNLLLQVLDDDIEELLKVCVEDLEVAILVG